MNNNSQVLDFSRSQVMVVYKHSRYSYVMERGASIEKQTLLKQIDPWAIDLFHAHEQNLNCIEHIKKELADLKIDCQFICRSDLDKTDLLNKLVIAIGGDGTLLDASHYCVDSPILGVNSDPTSSIGALCAANCNNFKEVFLEIIQGILPPTPLARLSVRINGQDTFPLALNDVLFCNKNPAAMSRFILSFLDQTESHRSSGVWIASAAGSTGGIYSSGAQSLPIEKNQAIFRLREPYWSNNKHPKLLDGQIDRGQTLKIVSNMTDGQIFIDGPHQSFDINLGDTIEISLAEKPLWLFDGPRLNQNRAQIIEERKAIRKHLTGFGG